MTNITFENDGDGSVSDSDSSIPKLIAFGNVLLDLSVKTRDNSILKKHELNEDDQCEVNIDKLAEIVEDATERYGNVKYNPGGSALNTCRILKSLGEENLIFFGAIGNDENGVILKGILEEQSLDECLQVLDGYRTGTCICLIYGKNRCLCANIGASLHFQKEHLIKIDNTIKFSQFDKQNEKRQIYYVEGYFIPKKFEVCKFIYEKYCKDTKNLLAVNLNASYICQNFTEQTKFLVKNADIVFANSWEMASLTVVCGFKNDEDTIEYFFNEYAKKGKTKIFIITKGSENVKTYIGSMFGRVQADFPVKSIPKDKIVDTTGAGDSFVSGFLYAYFRNQRLTECVQFGCDVAAKVIAQIGCNLPITSSASSTSDNF